MDTNPAPQELSCLYPTAAAALDHREMKNRVEDNSAVHDREGLDRKEGGTSGDEVGRWH